VSRRRKKYLPLFLLALLSIAVGFYVYENPAFRGWEEKALDISFVLRPAPRGEKIADAVLVMVDSKSLGVRFGYFDPLPRRYLAELIDTLAAHGAKVIGLDVALFDKHDILDPAGDTLLYESLRRAGNVVSVSAFELDESGAVRVRNPHPFFRRALKGVGYANLEVASVGAQATVRSVKPYVLSADSGLIPSFSTAMYCVASGLDAKKFLEVQALGAESEGYQKIPLDRGAMIINFVGPPPVWHKTLDGMWIQEKEGRIVAYRSGLVTDGAVQNSDAFAEKVVFVGSFSEFSLDQFLTPYYGTLFDEEPMRGVEVQANAFLTILHNRYLHPLSEGALLLVLALLATAGVVLTGRSALYWDIGILALLLILIGLAGYLCFVSFNLWIPTVSMGVTVVFAYVSRNVHLALTEKKERRRITGVFGQYVDERVVEQLVENPEMSRIGGENREVTVLFTDLKGFTKLSEQLGAEKIVKLMNIYLTEMTEIIQKNGGTIDKFIGDSIMAFWGAPVPNVEAPYLACLSALQMQTRLDEIRGRWSEFGTIEVSQRIGINTGVCIIGNVGSEKKTNYTAIGDTVNLASRLEGVNKRYGTTIAVSHYTQSKVAGRFVLREIEDVIVQGKTEPVKVFELRNRVDGEISAEERSFLECYEKGRAAFKKSDWATAASLFEQALTHHGGDIVCKIFLDRIKQQRQPSTESRAGNAKT
jgi:adenylate cyclase